MFYQIWYFSSGGEMCTYVCQSEYAMDACDIYLLDVGTETHAVLNFYNLAGSGAFFSILALENQEITLLVSDEYGNVYLTDRGNIMLTVEAYDAMYEPNIDDTTGHTWKKHLSFLMGRL